MASEEIPEDLRLLDNFPMYDTTFQDGPKLRQNLTLWATKTENLAVSLTRLADAFDRFHTSGLEHFHAANEMVASLQEISHQLENKRGNTLSSPLQEFSTALNNIWCYYEAFLGQTLMLNAEPIRDLANTFINLKRLYDELLHYRKEYVMAAEKQCACRHVSKMTDKLQYVAVSDECYTAHRSYQLLLSKYIKSMRQAHTQEMMNFLRRVIEHLLSLYSYHNFSAQVMKEQEPAINGLFTKAKEWRTYYEQELEVWGQLQYSIQKHLLAEYQHNMGLVGGAAPPTKSDVATALGKHVMRKIIPSYGAHTAPKLESPTTEWYLVEGGDALTIDTGNRHVSTSSPSPPGGKEKKKSPKSRKRPQNVSRAMSIPGTELPRIKPDKEKKKGKVRAKENRKMIKSVSDPDILAAQSMEAWRMGGVSLNGDVPQRYRTKSIKATRDRDHTPSPLVSKSLQSCPLDNDSDLIGQYPDGPCSQPTVQFLGRPKGRKAKRSLGSCNSLDDLRMSDGAASPTPEDASREGGTASPSGGRRTSKSGGGGILKRARESLLGTKAHEVPRPQQDLSQIAEEKSSRTDQSDLSTVRPLNPVIKVRSPSCPPAPSPRTQFDIQKLILPKPSTWIKSGYLWLRMKLPNNRYAWTHIYCVVDRETGQIMIQEQSLPEPRRLEDLLLCSVKRCTPEFIDRNFCFRVISPTSEHLFQTLNEQEMQSWIGAVQGGIAIALQQSDGKASPSLRSSTDTSSTLEGEELVPNAMATILAVPGNTSCADCASTSVEWASINLGIVLCISCSGVHRGLGVHVSKVRSLTLDKWDREIVSFMQGQGNDKSNAYYEATLGLHQHQDARKPRTNANKSERKEFIQQKYVALAFVPELTTSTML